MLNVIDQGTAETRRKVKDQIQRITSELGLQAERLGAAAVRFDDTMKDISRIRDELADRERQAYSDISAEIVMAQSIAMGLTAQLRAGEVLTGDALARGGEAIPAAVGQRLVIRVAGGTDTALEARSDGHD